jgi:hypothetical protein
MASGVRQEAGIRAVGALTPSQLVAATQAYAILRELAATPWSEPLGENEGPPPFLPRLVPARFNQAVLLDGGRGSGKTTALLTLLDAFCSIWDPQRRAAAGDTDHHRRFSPLIQDPGAEGAHRAAPPTVLVPLDVVDLHPLPDTANLFLHIAGRFDTVVKSVDLAGRPPPAWHPRSPGSRRRASEAWRTFVQAVAAGWDSNVVDRRAHLDPEAYAMELEEAATKGMAVHRKFQDFLDLLVADFRDAFGRIGTGAPALPMFVVPVDDADMNPQRATELIDLLRSLWHPRVVFLMTGDSGMFLTALRAHYLAVLRRPLARLRASDQELHHLGERAGPARLAEEVYARVIPRTHRCRLRPLPPADRLVPGGSEREVTTRLRRALARLQIGEEGRAVGLDAYFDANPQTLEALPDRLRGLIDMAMAIEHKLATPRPDRALSARAVAGLWWDALARSNLSPELESRVRFAVDVDDSTQQIAVAASSLWWEAVAQDLRSIDHYPFRITAGRVTRLEVSPPYRSDADKVLLPDPVAATLMLAADVATEDPHVFFVGASPAPRTFRGVFARSEYWSERLGAAVCVHWPLPAWTSFRDHVQFSRLWLAYHRTNPRAPLDALAKQFIEIVLAVDRQPFSSDVPELPVRSWDAIAADLAAYLVTPGSARSERHRTLAGWIVESVLLLAAPEYGLKPGHANALFKAFSRPLGQHVEWLEGAVARSRRRTAALREAVSAVQSAAGGPEGWLDARTEALRLELRDPDPEHGGSKYDWCLAYEPEAQASAAGAAGPKVEEDAGERAREMFRSLSVHVPVARGTFLSGRWESVADYLQKKPRSDLDLPAAFAEGSPLRAVLEPGAARPGAPASSVLPVLWKAGVKSHGDVVSSRGGRLRVEDHVSWADKPCFRARGPGEVIYNVFEVDIELGLDPEIGEPMRSLYRLAWDVAADENDVNREGQHGAALTSFWRGVSVHIPGSGPAFCPWPVPAFDALLDWELLDESWSSTLAAVQRHLGQDPDRNAAVMDTLARSLCEATMRVVEDRDRLRIVDEAYFEPEATKERAILRRVLAGRVLHVGARESQGKPRGRRWQAFKAWRDAVPLFAAPESGLSPDAALAILEACQLTVPGASAERLDGLRAQRLERATHAVGEDQAAALIAAADRIHGPWHPWARYVDRQGAE